VTGILSGALGSPGAISQALGETGAAVTAKALGLVQTEFTAAYHGIDGLLQDAAGNFVMSRLKVARRRWPRGNSE